MRRLQLITAAYICTVATISSSPSKASDPLQASVSGQLVFVRDHDLWLANADGTGQRRLLRKGEAPVWSPDRKCIAFLRGGEAWVLNLADMKTRQVSQTDGKAVTVTWRNAAALFVVRESPYYIRYDWRPTGKPIRFSDGPEGTFLLKNNYIPKTMLHDIIVVSVSGGSPLLWLGTVRTSFQQGQREFSGGQYVGNFDCPVVSPDRKHVAFIKDGDIWTVTNEPLEHCPTTCFADRVASVANIQLPIPVGDEYSSGAQRLNWTPDGQHIVYDVQRYSGSGVHEIWVMDIEVRDNIVKVRNRREIAKVGDAGGGICRHPCISPDGKYIAFQSYGVDSGSDDIWVTDLDGKNMRQLLSNAEQPDWR